MNYMMYVHELMYGTPMGPVVSLESIIQDRWDLYRQYRNFSIWGSNKEIILRSMIVNASPQQIQR